MLLVLMSREADFIGWEAKGNPRQSWNFSWRQTFECPCIAAAAGGQRESQRHPKPLINYLFRFVSYDFPAKPTLRGEKLPIPKKLVEVPPMG
jgi:hypothetical protein